MAVIECKVQIVNPLGLHARPAAEFVKLAAGFQSEILLAKADQQVNGKSILGIMTLAAECGSQLTLRVEGEDAEQAAHALADLVASGFGDLADLTDEPDG